MDTSLEVYRTIGIVLFSLGGATVMIALVFSLFDLWDKPIGGTRKKKLEARAASESEALREEAAIAEAAMSQEEERYATTVISGRGRRRRR
jgi:hypothetical protein